MSDYTPDWIHIYSGWWHFIPPGISVGLALAIALLAVFRRRLFPSIPRSFLALTFSLLIPVTLFLLFMAWSRNAWSIHAHDYIEKGASQSSLHGWIAQRMKLVFPPDSTVEASVRMGWREYTSWFGIRGGSHAIRNQALKLGYAEIKTGRYSIGDPLPQPVSEWVKKTGFQPDMFSSLNTGNAIHGIAIDTTRDLVLVTVTDY